MAIGGPFVSEIIFGLDLGQTKDPTALAGAERTTGPDGLSHYAFRYLKRFHVGTPYTSAPGSAEPGVVEFTDKLLTDPPFAGRNPILAIDQTGVGQPVVDRFMATGRLNIVPVTITAGHGATPAPPEYGYGWHVPKKLLVSTVQLLFQSHRLTIAARIPEAAVLVKELQNFRVKVTTAANATFEAWREGDHDDLVLAVAMACWVGENVCCGAWEVAEDADRRSLLADVPEGIFLDGWPW
jgi:hypothetical protein